MNVQSFSGSNPFVVFAKASILMSCKIQTLCVKTNIGVTFIPPKVIDGECVKILYCHNQNFTMCQRVLEIKMNEGNNDSSKQTEPELSGSFIEKMHWQIFRDYYVVYGYDCSHSSYEVEINTSSSLLQKFDRFFDKIPHDSSIAFINRRHAPFVPLFVKALLRLLGRKPPIDAKYDRDIVQTWLSNSEARPDLIAHSSTLNNLKTEFIINLSPSSLPLEQISGARSATSQYTHICLPTPATDELIAMAFLSSDFEKNDEAYLMHRINLEKYLRRMSPKIDFEVVVTSH